VVVVLRGAMDGAYVVGNGWPVGGSQTESLPAILLYVTAAASRHISKSPANPLPAFPRCLPTRQLGWESFSEFILFKLTLTFDEVLSPEATFSQTSF